MASGWRGQEDRVNEDLALEQTRVERGDCPRVIDRLNTPRTPTSVMASPA